MRYLSLLIITILFSYSAFALKPTHDYAMSPDTLGLKYASNTITTDDGVHLQSWTFYPADSIDNKTTLVLAHADAGNMSWSLMQAYYLVMNGYTVTLFDYRGFGKSDDFTIDNKYLYYNEFVKDLEAVMSYDRKQFPTHKTGIWAFSMGTIITSLLPAASQPDFIIGDSYVANMQAVKEAIKAKKKTEVLLPAGADKYEATLYKIKKPMLVFAGTEDDVTTAAEVMKLKAKLPQMQVVSYDGVHMQGFQKLSKAFLGSEYITAVNDFVGKLK